MGQFVAVLFIGFGIIEFFQGAGLGGLWLAFIGWFLLQAAGASYMQVRSRALLRGLRVKDVMSTDFRTVDPGTFLEEFVHRQLLPTGRRCFLVVTDSGLLGLITPSDVRSIEPQPWPYTSVQAAMRPARKVHSVSGEMPALEALEIVSREDINQPPSHPTAEWQAS